MAAPEDETPAGATPGDQDTPADGTAGDDSGSSFLLDQALESLERPRDDADELPVTSEAPRRMS